MFLWLRKISVIQNLIGYFIIAFFNNGKFFLKDKAGEQESRV